ncbi:MAG: alpha,2-mannosyltransferase [Thermoleophilaceae bacterium]|nr:alpha,2-mannosyltransferase [Thermoleophilaceae bacterium]
MSPSSRAWLERRLLVISRVGLTAGPLFLLGVYLVVTIQVGAFALDFHHAFWPAGQDLLHGRTPFPPATPAVYSSAHAFVYPPASALLLAPLTLLPRSAGEVVFTVLLLAATVAALRALGVRDWRCYGAALLWFPVINGLQSANLSLLFLLALALAWRYRDRVWIVAIVMALAIAAKLFLWPMLAWLLLRRTRAGVATIVLTMVLTLAGWLVVGFGEIPHFLKLVHGVTGAEQDFGYTPFALARGLGVSTLGSHVVGYGLGLAVLGASIVAGRREDGERRSFCLAIAASLLLSPIVWPHYLALLLVPLALARPRLSGLWFLGLPLILCLPPHFDGSPPAPWRIALALGVSALIFRAALVDPAPGEAMRAPAHARRERLPASAGKRGALQRL